MRGSLNSKGVELKVAIPYSSGNSSNQVENQEIKNKLNEMSQSLILQGILLTGVMHLARGIDLVQEVAIPYSSGNSSNKMSKIVVERTKQGKSQSLILQGILLTGG